MAKPKHEAAEAPKAQQSSVDVATEPMLAPVQRGYVDQDDPSTYPDWYTVDVPAEVHSAQIDPPDLPFGAQPPPEPEQ
jgi:hypothetical protein